MCTTLSFLSLWKWAWVRGYAELYSALGKPLDHEWSAPTTDALATVSCVETCCRRTTNFQSCCICYDYNCCLCHCIQWHVSQQSCFFVLRPLLPSPFIVLLSVLSLSALALLLFHRSLYTHSCKFQYLTTQELTLPAWMLCGFSILSSTLQMDLPTITRQHLY